MHTLARLLRRLHRRLLTAPAAPAVDPRPTRPVDELHPLHRMQIR
ncbi:hypothetical protein V6N00_16435 [Tersicoccus sp. MR15.9]